MKILRAVQQGMDIPENLDDLVLSEDEKEVSNKQDTVKNAEDVTTVETEAAKLRPEMSGQNLTEVPQTPEKLFRRQIPIIQKQKKSRDHRHKTDHKKTGRNPGFLITVMVKQENNYVHNRGRIKKTSGKTGSLHHAW